MAERNAPLPEYMRDRQAAHKRDAMLSGGAGLASALATIAAGEMPPAALGFGGLSMLNWRNAVRSADASAEARRGAEMWENTGLPQAPEERGPPPPGMMRLGGPTAFDQAFAELDAALIDLDGDGVPDVRVPQQSVQQPSNAMASYARAGQTQPANAMAQAARYDNTNFPSGGVLPDYGFGPVTQMSKLGLTPGADGEVSNTSRPQEYTAPIAEMTPPPIPGGQFIARAAPRVAGAIAGGLGLSAMVSDAGEAGAPRLTRSQQRQMEMERQRSEQDAANARARIEAETQAARQRGEDEARIAAERRQREQQQAEYEAQVGRATAARDFELSRDRRFSDTTVGRALDSLGGADALAAGAASGFVGRAVAGPARGVVGDVVKNYMLPAVEGAIGGFTAANLPLWYDANKTEVENPEKRAARAYARELPPGHPRKQEFMDYADSLPDQNPVREHAGREFREGLADRAISGGLEGAGAGVFGGNVARGIGQAAQGTYNAARNFMAPRGPAPPPPANAMHTPGAGPSSWGPGHPNYRPRGARGRFTAQ